MENATLFIKKASDIFCVPEAFLILDKVLEVCVDEYHGREDAVFNDVDQADLHALHVVGDIDKPELYAGDIPGFVDKTIVQSRNIVRKVDETGLHTRHFRCARDKPALKPYHFARGRAVKK